MATLEEIRAARAADRGPTLDQIRAARAKDQGPAPAEVPEGMFFNPDTGQMTSRDLLTGHHRQNATQGGAAARMGPHGATLGFSDEAVGLGELMARGPEAAKFAMENERAKIDANRSEYPVTSFASEAAGGVLVPASVVRGGAQATTSGKAVVQGAKAGATTGAFYAAGEGDTTRERMANIPGGLIGGAIGGAAAVPVGKVVMWAGSKIGKPVARLFSDRRYYTPEGGLSKAGQTALKQLGYNVDEVSDAFAREFSKGVDDGVDPALAAKAAEMGEFDIPAFGHNLTGDVNDFANFERARRGVGPDPIVKKAQQLGSQQDLAIRKAPDAIAQEIGGGVRGDQFDAAQAVTNRLDTIKGAEKAAAQAAYRAADDAGVTVPSHVAKGIAQRLQTRLADEEIDLTSDLFSKARGYMGRLAKRGDGENGVSLRLIDTFRKDLNATMSRADSEDLRALTIIKGEYDQWIDDVVSAKLFDGDEAGFAELKKARALWQQYAKDYMGKDAGSKFIRDMIDQDASPEMVMRWMFGSSKLGGGRMNANLARTLRDTLGEGSDEWNLVRQAAFRQLTQKPGTEVPGNGPIPWGAQKVSENIKTFFNGAQTRPLANAMFTPKERAQMLRLSAALNRTVPPPGAVNHSGTAYENARQVQKLWEGAAALIGYKVGGPAGAIGGREAARGASNGAAWLQARGMGAAMRGAKPIGAPAIGAIPAAQAGAVVSSSLLSPNRPK